MAYIYKEDWKANLQERLEEPYLVEDLFNVEYTDQRTVHSPFKPKPSTSSHTRGTAVTYGSTSMTDDTVTIDQGDIVAEFIDKADLAQTGYDMQMAMSDDQAEAIRTKIQTYAFGVYADAGHYFDNADLGGAAGNITLSISNIDEIITGTKRKFRKQKCEELMKRFGIAYLWSPEQFEKVELFAIANGYQQMDTALMKGVNSGYKLMGVEHLCTNDLTANHALAIIKKQAYLGILNTTYGDITVIENPPGASGGFLSGYGIDSRVDYKRKVWEQRKYAVMDLRIVTT